MKDKLTKEKIKPPQIKEVIQYRVKCIDCKISEVKEQLEYMEKLGDVMLVYIFIINIALIIKNKVFRMDIFSFLSAFVNYLILSANRIWQFFNKISQFAYKINNNIIADILYCAAHIVLLAALITLVVIVGYMIAQLLIKVFKKWDTTQSYIFTFLITLITYFSDIIDIKVFNINLLVIFFVLFISSVIIRCIYNSKYIN